MPDAVKPVLLEVERKFRIADTVARGLPEKLLSFGFQPIGDTFMKDTFLPTESPSDMLRVREEETVKPNGALEQRIVLTAKRWMVFPDGSREREEQEEEIGLLARDGFIRLGEKITGCKLLTFSKKRSMYKGKLGEFDSVVAIDYADGLGAYSGHYMEIEVLVEINRDLTDVRQKIKDHAENLLGSEAEMETMSYMDMLRLSGHA
ncbi:MAG: CYTH domain-containing protein [Candidatus Obscuribacterales bacterium]|nr:CYTH domain-containing protein [Candidatus Obscuribacterales bacterium]